MTPQYLEELRESMDTAVQDLAEAGREWESACMRQAAEAIDHLRRKNLALLDHVERVEAALREIATHEDFTCSDIAASALAAPEDTRPECSICRRRDCRRDHPCE